MFFDLYHSFRITKKHLRQAKPDNVFRLARCLHLHTEGMSLRQVIRLIVWRLSPRRQVR